MMTNNSIPEALAFCRRVSLGARRGLRHTPGLSWLGHSAAYPVCTIVISLLSLGTSLFAARVLEPRSFGTFSLLATLFQLAGKADLGLSQLADQRLTNVTTGKVDGGLDILRARVLVGAAILGVMVPAAALAALVSDKLPAIDIAMATIGGAAFMVGNGPVTVYRATSKVWEFTVAALALQAGLTAPRLAGLLLGGVTGWFLATALWFGVLAVVLLSFFNWRVGSKSARALPLILSALPLFAFNGLWEIYLAANRWISASLAPAEAFGLFAFSANLAFTGITMVGTIAQVRYPRLLREIVGSSQGSCSNSIEREASRLCLALSVCMAIALLAAGPMIRIIFPHYEGAIGLTRAMAVSCIPLCFVACALPIAIPLARRPLTDATRMFGISLAFLVAAMVAGDRIANITGQAWACTVAGLVLAASLVFLMYRLGIVRGSTACRIVFLQVAATACLTLLAFGLEPAVGESASFPPWKSTFGDDFESPSSGMMLPVALGTIG